MTKESYDDSGLFVCILRFEAVETLPAHFVLIYTATANQFRGWR